METIKRCSNCRKQTNNGKTVWVNYKNKTLIRYLCEECIENLKNDKKVISYEIK